MNQPTPVDGTERPGKFTSRQRRVDAQRARRQRARAATAPRQTPAGKALSALLDVLSASPAPISAREVTRRLAGQHGRLVVAQALTAGVAAGAIAAAPGPRRSRLFRAGFSPSTQSAGFTGSTQSAGFSPSTQSDEPPVGFTRSTHSLPATDRADAPAGVPRLAWADPYRPLAAGAVPVAFVDESFCRSAAPANALPTPIARDAVCCDAPGSQLRCALCRQSPTRLACLDAPPAIERRSVSELQSAAGAIRLPGESR